MTWQFASKMSGFETFMYATVYKLLYYLNIGVCWLVDLFYNIFDKLGGLCTGSYNGDADLLIGLLFSNGTVSSIFWALAILAIVLAATFAVAVFVRRSADDAKFVARPVKEILRRFSKTAVLLLSMTLAIVVLFNATGLLLQQAQYAWIDAQDAKDEVIEFTDDDFAAMARVLNTIGNYSLNPVYNNRYNINSCFNEIRPDMQYLQSRGVFRYDMQSLQEAPLATWQNALQRIAQTGSLTRELKLDLYYEDVSEAILDTMELMRINGTFKPLENYKFKHDNPNTTVPVDRALFLTATLSAAKNPDFNHDASLTDALRYSYYYGEKSIYDLDAVNEGFDIGSAAILFLIFAFVGLMILKSLLVIIFNFVARIFNMLMLYLFAIPTIASSDKKETKKWAISFVVHALATLATLLLVRIMLILLPLILAADISVFSAPSVNALVKLALVLLNVRVAERIACLITRKLTQRENLRSVFLPVHAEGKKTNLLRVVDAAKLSWCLTKQVLLACAFTDEAVAPSEPIETVPMDETPCDAAILQKYDSWTNS